MGSAGPSKDPVHPTFASVGTPTRDPAIPTREPASPTPVWANLLAKHNGKSSVALWRQGLHHCSAHSVQVLAIVSYLWHHHCSDNCIGHCTVLVLSSASLLRYWYPTSANECRRGEYVTSYSPNLPFNAPPGARVFDFFDFCLAELNSRRDISGNLTRITRLPLHPQIPRRRRRPFMSSSAGFRSLSVPSGARCHLGTHDNIQCVHSLTCRIYCRLRKGSSTCSFVPAAILDTTQHVPFPRDEWIDNLINSGHPWPSSAAARSAKSILGTMAMVPPQLRRVPRTRCTKSLHPQMHKGSKPLRASQRLLP
jgi:hypothetical protein